MSTSAQPVASSDHPLLSLGVKLSPPADRGPGSSEDERKALLQLLDVIVTLAPAATGLSHAMGLLIRDARRWQALLKSGGRVRVLGSAKLGQPGYQHIGLELWTEHPCEPGYDASDRTALTKYADAAAASPALVSETAHA